MKKNLTILLIALLAISCSSPQKRAEKIARMEVCKRLYYPDSYEPIETKVDSAFTTIYTNEDILNIIDKLDEYNENIQELERKLDWELIEQRSAKSSISLWSGPYMGSYGAEQRRQAQEELKEAEQNIQNYQTEIDNLNGLLISEKENIKTLISQCEEGKFLGWAIAHSYRAKNGNDNLLIGNSIIITDPEMETVIKHYTEDDFFKLNMNKEKIDDLIIELGLN